MLTLLFLFQLQAFLLPYFNHYKLNYLFKLHQTFLLSLFQPYKPFLPISTLTSFCTISISTTVSFSTIPILTTSFLSPLFQPYKPFLPISTPTSFSTPLFQPQQAFLRLLFQPQAFYHPYFNHTKLPSPPASLTSLTLLGSEHVVLGESMDGLTAHWVSLQRNLEALGGQCSVVSCLVDVSLQ